MIILLPLVYAAAIKLQRSEQQELTVLAKRGTVESTPEGSKGGDTKKNVPTLKPQWLAPEEAFKFKVSCGNLRSSDCSSAKAALSKAGARIAKEILFRKPVNVKVTFSEFTLDEPNLGEDERITRVGTVVSHTAKKLGGNPDEPYLQYPQALLKQADVSGNPHLGTFDISIQFNEDSHWDFGNAETGGDDIPDNMRDFQSHELTHGLGFSSNLAVQAYDPPGNAPALKFLSPKVEYDRDAKILPISVFDSLIHGKKSVLDLSRQYLTPGQPNDYHYFKSLFGNPKSAAAAAELYRMVLNENLYLHFSDGTVTPIFSVLPDEKQFILGNSLSHFVNSQKGTADFLMTSYSLADGELSDKGQTSIYGPWTLKTMEALGYATKRKPQIIKLAVIN